MSFNISNFRTSISTDGILKDNSFLMVITPPKVMQTQKTDSITLRCKSSMIPGFQLMTQDGYYRYGYGVPEKIPYSATFSDFNATFILDKKASQYQFFHTWMNHIFNFDTQNGILTNASVDGAATPFELEYKSNYATTINIFVYDEMAKKSMETTIFEAYPISINDTSLSWDSQNELINTTVNFSYRNLITKTAL